VGLLGDMGVALARFRCGQMRLIFREKPTQDYGIDAEIEVLDGARATGRLVSAQIKCGKSYFRESNEEGFIFRFEARHYEYWISHSLPVIAILVDHEKEICYWALVSASAAQNTGNGYKINIPRSQHLNLTSRQRLIDIANPIVAPSAYELIDEEDQSTGGARRISRYIRLNSTDKPWTKESIRQLILQVTSDARASQYFRNEVTEATYAGRSADVVWVYVYHSESHRDLGAYIARAIWVEPSLDEEFRPIEFGGERDASGLIIQWNDDFDQLVKLVDERRVSKSDYISSLKEPLYITESVIHKYHNQCHDNESGVDYSEFVTDAITVSEAWRVEVVPPLQCQRLDDRRAEMVALLDNARIYAQRILQNDDRRWRYQFQKYIDDAFEHLGHVKYEMKLVR